MDSEDENDFSQESEEEEDDTSSVEDSSDNDDDDNEDDNDSDDEAKTIEEEEEEEDIDEGETEDEDEEGEEEEEEIEEIEEDETPKPQIDIGSPVKTLPVIVPVNVPVTAPSVGSKLSVVPLVPPTPKTISETIPMAVPKIPKSLLSPVTPATTLAPVKSPIVPAPVSPVSPISTQPISTQPPKITETAQKKPESAPVGMTAEELKKLKITQLKDILRTMKLKLGGKKDELIDRILSSGKAYEKPIATQPIVKLATKKRVEQPIVIQEPKTLEELLVKNDTESQTIFDMRRMYAHAAMSVYNNQINPATAVLIGKMATNKALYGVTYPAEEDAIVNYINSVIMGS